MQLGESRLSLIEGKCFFFDLFLLEQISQFFFKSLAFQVMIQQLVYTIFHYFSLLCTIDTYLYSMEIEILRQKVHFESIHFLPDLELHQMLVEIVFVSKNQSCSRKYFFS